MALGASVVPGFERKTLFNNVYWCYEIDTNPRCMGGGKHSITVLCLILSCVVHKQSQLPERGTSHDRQFSSIDAHRRRISAVLCGDSDTRSPLELNVELVDQSASCKGRNLLTCKHLVVSSHCVCCLTEGVSSVMAHLTILRTYAERVDPNTLPPTVKLCHSDASVTIFDKYPKAYFHFILIPLIRTPLTAANLRDLRSLLQLPREQAKALLQTIRRDALAAKALVEAEMLEKYGCTWGIQLGFHSVPSLEYVPVPLKHLQCVPFRLPTQLGRGTKCG